MGADASVSLWTCAWCTEGFVLSADDKTRASHNNMCLNVKGQDSSQNADHIVIRNGDQFSDTFVKWGDGLIALGSLGYKRVMCLDVTARKQLPAPTKHGCKSSVVFRIVLSPLAQILSTDPKRQRQRAPDTGSECRADGRQSWRHLRQASRRLVAAPT